MRIIVFSNKSSFIRGIKIVSENISSKIMVEEVSDKEMARIALNGYDNLFVIDDDLFDYFDEKYLDVLKKLQVKVIVLLNKRENIIRYMPLNIVNYSLPPIDWDKMDRCLRYTLKRNEMTLKISKKYNIRNIQIT